jgi:hypothetical protein
MFFVEYDRFSQSSAAKADQLPFPQYCDIPLFLNSLEKALAEIPSPDIIQSFNSTKNIDKVIDSRFLEQTRFQPLTHSSQDALVVS